MIKKELKHEDLVQILNKVKIQPSESLESDVIEFKCYASEKSLHNSKDLAGEVSAFANHKGGAIILGVKDDSDIIGTNWEEQLVGFSGIDLLELGERLSGRLKPKLPLTVFCYEFESKEYVVINVPKSSSKLVSTSSGKYFIRDGRSSRPMEPEEVEFAVKALQHYDWSADLVDVEPSTVLDASAVESAKEDFANRRGLINLSDNQFLEAISALRDGQLTNAGLLFLGTKTAIERHLGIYEYRFSWKTKSGNLIINDVWQSCLWDAIHKAKSHFQRCNSSSKISYKGKMYDAPLLDPTAFHEAWLNALVHRDYSQDGMVSISFLTNDMTITSPGIFYGGVTAENIVRHEPRHRNKVLAQMLMHYQMVDRAGMGVLRIGLRSLMYGREFPRFREADDSVEVTMYGKHIAVPVFIVTANNPDLFGLADLLILNLVVQNGYMLVTDLERSLRSISNDPWEDLNQSVNQLDYIEFVGRRDGLYVRVSKSYVRFFDVRRKMTASSASHRYLALYQHLKSYGEASNAELTPVLGYSHASQTSKFLGNASFVQRRGNGPTARWTLVDVG